MTTSIFVNIPVRDLAAAMAYYRALGFAHNPQFTDETAACIVLGETIYVMLLTGIGLLGLVRRRKDEQDKFS